MTDHIKEARAILANKTFANMAELQARIDSVLPLLDRALAPSPQPQAEQSENWQQSNMRLASYGMDAGQPAPTVCGVCNGRGERDIAHGETTPCPNCGGTGLVGRAAQLAPNVPEGLTPMLLANAAFCLEMPDDKRTKESRQSIIDKLLRIAGEMQKQRTVNRLAAAPLPAESKDAQDAELKRRLEVERAMARTAAFCDLLKLFPKQRGRIANLLAHKWEITSIEIKSEIGLTDPNSKSNRYEADAIAAQKGEQP